MEKTALILQHTPEERGGLFETILEEKGWALDVRPLFEGALLPTNLKDHGMVLIMGGPMSANDEASHPFLKEEIPFIRKALKIGHSVMGICLGAQLMAKALGARVYPGPHKEIGWYWLNQTPSAREDPLFSLLDPYFLVFQWHGETFDLPSEALCLSGNLTYPNQAFRFGTSAYGLQFHMEITKPMLKTWLSSWVEEIKEARPQPITAQGILGEAKIYLDRVNKQARTIFGEFIQLVEGTYFQNCKKKFFTFDKNVDTIMPSRS
jgi:GMP synthase (glutamine-hydrolysing)